MDYYKGKNYAIFQYSCQSRDRKTNMTAQAESARAQRLTGGVYFLVNEFALTSGGALMKINSVIFSSDKLIPSITIPHFLPVNI